MGQKVPQVWYRVNKVWCKSVKAQGIKICKLFIYNKAFGGCLHIQFKVMLKKNCIHE